jgi:hypothetical protein
MSCNGNTSQQSGDGMQAVTSAYPFGNSATGWLLGEAVRHLHSADKESEALYKRAVEVLSRNAEDLVEAVRGLSHQAGQFGSGLRWSLLHVLGDAGKADAAKFLVATTLEKLPEEDREHCESIRDTEVLVRTMAIEAIAKIATRYPEASWALLEIVKAQPAHALLIEAVKAAADLGLRDKVREMLPENQRWILDIKRVKATEVVADPEREDGKERSFTPPKMGDLYTAPRVSCCSKKEK